VHLARELARCWGNIRYGFEIVASTVGRFRIVGWAWDLNPGNNTFVQTPDEFSLMHQRTDRETGEVEWVEVDERDARELLNRRGAIVERNAILKLIPPHVVAAAQEATRKTRTLDSKQKLAADKIGTIARLRASFAELDVTVKMLELWLAHKLEEITSEEVDELREIYTAIKDGASKVSEHFMREEPKPAAEAKPGEKAEEPKKGDAEVAKLFEGADAPPQQSDPDPKSAPKEKKK
jgi:hypothetical protein